MKNKGNVKQLPGTQPTTTKEDMFKAVERMRDLMPAQREYHKIQAEIVKDKYDKLVMAGFNEQQALDIVMTRPLYE